MFAAITAVVAVIASILLLPEKAFTFGLYVGRLNQAYIDNWLEPRKWEGAFSANAEGYVNSRELALSEDSDMVLFLYFNEVSTDFDGELISDSFCKFGLPYRNLLVRGVPQMLLKDRISLIAYDFIGGKTVVIGEFTGQLDGPVIELSGWRFGSGSRLAKDLYASRDDIETLCDRAPEQQ